MLLVIWLTCECRGGLGFKTGKEWQMWTVDRYSVIIAHVSSVSELQEGDNGTHRATLEPLALLAGSLDPSKHSALNVTFSANGMSSSIKSPPKQGAIVLAVIQGDNFVISDVCTFMPGQSALVELTGLGDRRVVETLKKIQDARAHADPDPSGPATRPSARAAKGR